MKAFFVIKRAEFARILASKGLLKQTGTGYDPEYDWFFDFLGDELASRIKKPEKADRPMEFVVKADFDTDNMGIVGVQCARVWADIPDEKAVLVDGWLAENMMFCGVAYDQEKTEDANAYIATIEAADEETKAANRRSIFEVTDDTRYVKALTWQFDLKWITSADFYTPHDIEA